MKLSTYEAIVQMLTSKPLKAADIAHRCGVEIEEAYGALVRLYDEGRAAVWMETYNRDDKGWVKT